VQENPGITIADLAKRMNIKPNYLYRVLPQLQKDGKLRKKGSGWHPAS
jgi:DNA-binding IscR family transcriptional regulator